jgi:hypothetical protein
MEILLQDVQVNIVGITEKQTFYHREQTLGLLSLLDKQVYTV